jgi:hypothetical protein
LLPADFAFLEKPMITITLPDGSQRQFPEPVTVAGVAASIGTGLAKAALGGKVDGKLVDTSFLIERKTPSWPSSPTRMPTAWR